MLEVSRPDIDVEVLTEFPAEQRFLKLPVGNYLKLLDYEGRNSYDELNRPQIAFFNAVNHPKYRFIVAAFARRLGKTFAANVAGQLVTLMPGSHVLIISPNYNLSSISFEIQRKLIKKFDLEVEKDNAKDRLIELSNGSTIRMGSVSTVDSCVGRSYDLIIFDEAALTKDGLDAFNISLRPTLDRPNAKAIFISTPRGKNNWFSIFHRRGFDPLHPEWVSMVADYSENPRMAESDVAEAKRSMSKAEFEQEYLASFTSFEGQIYNLNESCVQPFNRSEHGAIEIIAGLDPGYRDPTALCVIAYLPNEDKFWIIDEYLESEAVTSVHAEVIQSKTASWGIEAIFIDSSAAQFAADLAYTYDIATLRAKKQVLEGIAYVQTLVEQGRIMVDPACVHTLEMFDQYQWNANEQLIQEKPLHDKYSHMADALRYAIYTYTL